MAPLPKDTGKGFRTLNPAVLGGGEFAVGSDDPPEGRSLVTERPLQKKT